jgi:CheY-like chemotaxis protein
MQQLLMIEDDARLAQMVGEYLERSGFGVTHAIDAKAAWRCCRTAAGAPGPGDPGPDAAGHGRAGSVPPPARLPGDMARCRC